MISLSSLRKNVAASKVKILTIVCLIAAFHLPAHGQYIFDLKESGRNYDKAKKLPAEEMEELSRELLRRWRKAGFLPSGIRFRTKKGKYINKPECFNVVDGLVDKDEKNFDRIFRKTYSTFKVTPPHYQTNLPSALQALMPFKAIATYGGFKDVYLLASKTRDACRKQGCKMAIAYQDGLRHFVTKPVFVNEHSVLVFQLGQTSFERARKGLLPSFSRKLDLFGIKTRLNVSEHQFLACWSPQQTINECFYDFKKRHASQLPLKPRVPYYGSFKDKHDEDYINFRLVFSGDWDLKGLNEAINYKIRKNIRERQLGLSGYNHGPVDFSRVHQGASAWATFTIPRKSNEFPRPQVECLKK